MSLRAKRSNLMNKKSSIFKIASSVAPPKVFGGAPFSQRQILLILFLITN
ncbi:MAG: hypothetical protein GWO87_02510 [Xanthomonadaceae bacterium]|nr:hypothetical protein [Rhodospirillaceae bacterium]NIA18037.1 hypothetical protein [Xanthomonadaceae bacterium]